MRWHSSFDYYDEIWVPTDFTRQAIAAVSPIPVRKITFPLDVGAYDAAADRRRFNLPEKACVFLFTFDFFSTVERKNPAAVIAAFRLAFRQNDDALLVLKSINADQHRDARESLGKLAQNANILFMDAHVAAEEMNALFASADCYVSLHRSEGLGLGMAHAMSQRKPVIGTNYSGNLDFMNSDNSLLVNYTMTELGHDSGPYEQGTRWAEPDVEHAANLMRWVYENRIEARALGERAAQSIRATLDPTITSAEITARLYQLDDGSSR